MRSQKKAMRVMVGVLISFVLVSFCEPVPARVPDTLSPLSVFSTEWDKPEYRVCNTAADASFLSEPEKQIIYVLNLARANPPLFTKTVIEKYPSFMGRSDLTSSDYYITLRATMRNRKPLPLLQPDLRLYESAHCHAVSSGERGYVGHNRKTSECKDVKYFFGECCQYGYDDPLKVVMALLIDEGVPSLGHRDILLSPYNKIGVSLQPHRSYRWNAVLDLE